MAGTTWQIVGAVRSRLRALAGTRAANLAAADTVEPPLREGLFSTAQLEGHARSLASNTRLGPKRGPEMLLRRLADNEKVIRQAYGEIASATGLGHAPSPAATWLVENYTFIEQQIEQVRLIFPAAYSSQLPRVGGGPLKGFPRVYEIAIELVSHTDGRVDALDVAAFIRSYQGVRSLELGELWAVPIMISLALVENLRRISRRIAWRRSHRESAANWAGRFMAAVQQDPKSLITVLADFVQSKPATSAPFLSELLACLQGTHPAMALVIDWVEQELSERGQTLELIQLAESHDQAVDHASISHSITSLRQLERIDWRTMVESLSTVETILRQDPSGTHAKMDFRSRDLCRREIEGLSRRSGRTEEYVALIALRLAGERSRRQHVDARETTVGYFLIGEGRLEIESQIGYRPYLRQRAERCLRRHALPVYLLVTAVTTAVLSLAVILAIGPGTPWWATSAATLSVLIAVSRSAVALVNGWVCLSIPPWPLLRLDFSKGIPHDHRTAVIIPVMLSSAGSIDRLLEHLERRYLGNRGPNLLMVLLTDLPDALQEQMPEDQLLLERAVAGIRRLNAEYCPHKETVFHLLHRPRLWNPQQQRWMGHERKRGKIEHFNRLVLAGVTEPYARIEGDVAALRSARYGIVLDADTQLPPQAVWQMVAALAHPLNRPLVDGRSQCVVRGYGVLQPRLAVSLPQSQRTRYASLFAGDVGLDPYTREVSNVYQDLFGQGQFVGKGIYDIQAFDASISARFPDNRILSHDLIEGCHARCGFLSDVELLEDHPEHYLADVSRRRRWARGDWQIARWLLGRVPEHGGGRRSNPLSPLAKWMILDNLRRTLVPAAMLAALVIGWFAWPSGMAIWTGMLLLVFMLPDVLRSLRALGSKPRNLGWRTYLPHAVGSEVRGWAISLLELLLIPFHAFVYVGEIVRTHWRLARRRRLLEWQTASDAGRQATTALGGTVLEMWPALAVVAAIGCALAILARLGHAMPWQALVPIGVLAAWASSPVIMWLLGNPPHRRLASLDEQQQRFLRKTARRTWQYFAQFVSPDHHWLPPDNVQQDPPIGEAARTSPTNIGMALLGSLTACDFGYLSVGGLLDRVSRMLGTMEELPRHRGHFLNWYDTRTLQPLPPRYVSTADSGNLSGALVALQAGLAELTDRPILPPAWRNGLDDLLGILLDEVDAERTADGSLASTRAALVQLRELLASGGPGLEDAHRVLTSLSSATGQMEPSVQPRAELAYWVGILRRQTDELRSDLEWLVPGPAAEPANGALMQGAIPSLRELASLGLRDNAADRFLSLARERAAGRIAAITDMADHCRELSEMDLDLLYDPDRKLLAIGYNVDAQQRDPGYYDLLASEARLCSYLGIARGQLPIEHWFHLGRQLAPGGHAAVLVSWSGSMFEYLMPMLLMPHFDATLIEHSCQQAVARQIRYGLRRDVPWGISESCYNQVDAGKAYQYRAFGVPGLGLKHGLRDDLVIAPYATMLAVMVEPHAAADNLATMADLGFVGRYGFFEAVDYTPGRVGPGEKQAVVRSHMAHHSGMGLVALGQAMLGRPMHRRFLADPRMRAALLLLQEKVPLADVRTRLDLTRDEPPLRQQVESVDASVRTLRSPNAPTPDVHLLSNGRYHVMITAAGSGASRWQDLALTRWQEDATRDHWGTFVFVRDLDTREFWSATPQPTHSKNDDYQAVFSQGLAEFTSTRHDIHVQIRVAVSPEDDVEVRRLVLSNRSDKTRHIEATSYAEVALLNGMNASEQPAFNGLFLEVEAIADQSALICRRRTRSPEETWPLFFHGLNVQHDADAEGVSFETDRARFIGRGSTLSSPTGMARDLAGPRDYPLDPVLVIRRSIRLEPGQSATVDAVWGVSADRASAMSLLERYRDANLSARVFELARMHSQILLHELQASDDSAQSFLQMAGLLLYAHGRLRARASLIARNRKGQSALWAYGISGDRPIALLRIQDTRGLDLVRQMIQAHAYWRHQGLQADLVILSEAYAGYRQNLLDGIIGLINAGPEAKTLDQPGGIFVRNVAQVPEEDSLLLQTVSRIVLSDRAGTLADQLKRQMLPEPEPRPLEPVHSPEPRVADAEASNRDLMFFNGLGGFTPDGREYVIVLDPGRVTPAPWVNVLANSHFGSVVSESGAAYTWYQNAHEFRLTPWYNDAVTDVSGEGFYIRDEESGVFWSPMPSPARGRTGYVSRHGLGYSAFEHREEGIFSETFVYVATEAPLKFVAVTLRNLSNRARLLSLTGYVEWVLGESRQRNAMHVVTRLDPVTGAIFASNSYSLDFGDTVAFLHCSHPQRTITSRRTEFLGRNGSPRAPEAMSRQSLSNRMGAGVDPCAAIEASLEMAAGDQVQVVFVLGAAENEHQARSLVGQWGGVDNARRALEEVWDSWKRNLGGVYVETPDASVNLLVNHWLLYQTLACRLWGRSGFYQSGGAYGFRDQLQDSLALLYECPWLTRQQVVLAASHQYQNGDVQHWWHPPQGRGVRTRFSDDYLWLPYATCRYINVTGDTGILDEQGPFLEAPPLEPGQESHYGLPRISDRSGSLWDHCVRALDRGMRYGAHGLPLMGCGDWNDGMNRIGRGGTGESVWLAFFLYDVLRAFGELAQRRGKSAYAEKCRSEAASLDGRIRASAWDGRWYLRAFFDDGRPLGSARNTQCQIDLLPQAWAVLSGAGDPLLAKQALGTALERLVDTHAQIIRLFDPPFDGDVMDPGYIRGYLPGVRENGGQYTHAAIWAAMAAARMGDGDQAWRLFSILNPVHHADTPAGAQRYKVEPYVVAADVYSVKGHEGRGGWTWYTGSAGWMYRFLVEDLLGLRLDVDKLSFAPLLPPDWHEYTLHYRYRNTFYHIHVVRMKEGATQIHRVVLDGVEQHDKSIHLVDDGQERSAVVEMKDSCPGVE